MVPFKYYKYSFRAILKSSYSKNMRPANAPLSFSRGSCLDCATLFDLV